MFMLGYRIDEYTSPDGFIFKKIKLNKKTAKFFFYKNKVSGILNASLLIQCLGYLCIPISLIAILVILINNYVSDKVVNMLFCMVAMSIMALAGLYSTIILIISKIMNRRK